MDVSGRRFIQGEVTVVGKVLGSNRRKEKKVTLALFID
jgi:hypothetical protein